MRMTCRDIAEKNNSVIRKIVDLETSKKSKLKWGIYQPKGNVYRPTSDRTAVMNLDLNRTIIPVHERQKAMRKEKGGISITTAEIIRNNRDVDSRYDKRNLPKEKKKRASLNRTMYSPHLKSPFTHKSHSIDPGISRGTDFFVTGGDNIMNETP